MQDKRWKNGKGYHKYCYTVKDIAQITGRAIGTIRNDMSKGRLVMDDLESVVNYINFLEGEADVPTDGRPVVKR